MVRNTTIYFIFISFISAVSSSVILFNSSCATMSAARIDYHCWDAFQQRGSEKLGFALYTYVLLPYNINIKDEKNEIAKKYANLLTAITTLNPYYERDMEMNRYHMNIFYIPGEFDISPDGKHYFNPDKYNFQLSQKYIQIFANTLRSDETVNNDLNNKCGPFLISLHVPLKSFVLDKEGKEKIFILYANLSDQNDEGMMEAIQEYKKWIVQDHKPGVDYFESLKLSLLSWFLDANNTLRIMECDIKTIKSLLEVI